MNLTPREKRYFEAIHISPIINVYVGGMRRVGWALASDSTDKPLTKDGLLVAGDNLFEWDNPIRVFCRLTAMVDSVAQTTDHNLNDFVYFKYFPMTRRVKEMPMAAKRMAYLRVWGRLVAGDL